MGGEAGCFPYVIIGIVYTFLGIFIAVQDIISDRITITAVFGLCFRYCLIYLLANYRIWLHKKYMFYKFKGRNCLYWQSLPLGYAVITILFYIRPFHVDHIILLAGFDDS